MFSGGSDVCLPALSILILTDKYLLTIFRHRNKYVEKQTPRKPWRPIRVNRQGEIPQTKLHKEGGGRARIKKKKKQFKFKFPRCSHSLSQQQLRCLQPSFSAAHYKVNIFVQGLYAFISLVSITLKAISVRIIFKFKTQSYYISHELSLINPQVASSL